MHVVPVPCLKDNYAYLVVDEPTQTAAVVDPSEAEPVISAAERAGVKIVAIWNTHHHWDHTGGNEELAARLGVEQIVAHASDDGRIKGQTRKVEEGDTVSVGGVRAKVLHIPGHTLGAIAYVVDGQPGAVFTGDTLFLAGCGRLFEGTPAQMHASLAKLAALPDDTRVYCGHEYTESNLRFAAHVEPSNADVARAREEAKSAREVGQPTVPGTIAREKRVNPFLRERSPEIQKTLGIDASADAVSVFAAIRKAKDSF